MTSLNEKEDDVAPYLTTAGETKPRSGWTAPLEHLTEGLFFQCFSCTWQAEQLINAQTSNFTECFMGLRSYFDGGKMYNCVQSGHCMIKNSMIQMGITVCKIAIENEWRMRTACYRDNGWNLYTICGGLSVTMSTIWAKLRMPANSGKPKAMKNLGTSFVCTLLMGECRGIKLVPAAV